MSLAHTRSARRTGTSRLGLAVELMLVLVLVLVLVLSGCSGPPSPGGAAEDEAQMVVLEGAIMFATVGGGIMRAV